MMEPEQPEWFMHTNADVPWQWQERYDHAASINADFRWFVIQCARFAHWKAEITGLWDWIGECDTMYPGDYYMAEVARDLLLSHVWNNLDFRYMYAFMMAKGLYREAYELDRAKDIATGKSTELIL